MILWPRADIRFGCIAANILLALRHGTLSISEFTFTFPEILLIYLYMSLVHMCKSAVIEPSTLLAKGFNFYIKGHMMVTSPVPLNLNTDFVYLLCIDETESCVTRAWWEADLSLLNINEPRQAVRIRTKVSDRVILIKKLDVL